jgi:uncharacterized protein YbjT (DUF2867 family)
MPISLIITGATGMVGEGVLNECIADPRISSILLISRRPGGINHPKVSEIIHAQLNDIRPLREQVKGYDACLFCMGVSSIGMNEAEYTRLTYDLTLDFAQVLAAENPQMTFCYISGSGTDSSEKGRMMWARVKGKTENDLMRLPFKRAFMFRPGYLQPTRGLKNTLKFYRYIDWMYPLFKIIMPKQVSTLRELGKAMIETAVNGYSKSILEVKDIVSQAAR